MTEAILETSLQVNSIDRVRRLCLALPEAYEQEAWGEPTFRVGKRLFGTYANADNHHGAGKAALWCNAPVGVQEILVRSSPRKFFVPPYVGVRGWIGIRLEEVADAEIEELVLQSYCMVAPKKLLRAARDRPTT